LGQVDVITDDDWPTGRVTDLQRVTSREAKLYSVAVVDYLLWLLSPINLEWWLPRADSAGDVDGRLLTASPAWRVSGIETTPLAGTRFPS